MDPPLEMNAMQPPTLPSNSWSFEDPRPPYWIDLQAETGFSTYKEFLEALKQKGPQFEDLRVILAVAEDANAYLPPTHKLGEVIVLDILKDRSTSISLRLQGPEMNLTGFYRDVRALEVSTQVLQHLRSPPENVRARIVLWSIKKGSFPHPSMIDALGLGLQISPSFFNALYSITLSKYRTFNEQECVVIGQKVAAMTRNYQFEGDAPPTLLIAGKPDLLFEYDDESLEWQEMELRKGIEEVLSWGPSGSMLPCRSAIDKLSQSDAESLSSSQYVNLANKYVQDNNGVDAEEVDPLLIAMLPLLHLEALRLRVRCSIVQSLLLSVQNPHRDSGLIDDFYRYLGDHRFWLRRDFESLEKSSNHFKDYVRLQGAKNWLQSKAWSSEEERMREAVIEGRRMEAEIRDFLQLKTGDLSILESRKSIKLSNQQMDEAKRGERCEQVNRRMER